MDNSEMSEDPMFLRAINLDTPLTSEECGKIFAHNPQFLEIREFLARYNSCLNNSSDTTKNLYAHMKKERPPVASLRDIINSLLEERRVNSAIQFLNIVDSKIVTDDGKIITNLLLIFKPTEEIEEEMKKRSALILDGLSKSELEYSSVWKIDNEKRKGIIQTQRQVLLYLGSLRSSFSAAFHKAKFANEPWKFWEYFSGLIKEPQTIATPALETERETNDLEASLYRNRLKAASIILDHMCVDLGNNLKNTWSSVFLSILSNGMYTSGRINNLKTIQAHLYPRLNEMTSRECQPLEHTSIVKSLIDMFSVATTCGSIDRTSLVQDLAHYIADLSPCAQTKVFDAISQDTLAVEVIDYILITWYRFAVKTAHDSSGITKRQALRMPLGIERIGYIVSHVRPVSKKETALDWVNLISILGRLVRRASYAYIGHLSIANMQDEKTAIPGSFSASPLFVCREIESNALVSGVSALCKYLETKFSSESMDEDEDDSNKNNSNKNNSNSEDEKQITNNKVSNDNNDDYSNMSGLELRSTIFAELGFMQVFLTRA